ncbi:MAG: biotin/lipoate A/B protein ligase family protein [Ignavibacteriaceae bacterium]
MSWSYYNTGAKTGLFNMNLDIALAGNIRESGNVFRLYRWEPYCISLGANQSEEILDHEKLKEHGIDFVKRPTGGRAILHSQELTYSVIIPLQQYDSPRKIYHDINCALKAGLILFDDRLNDIQLESDQPDFREQYRNMISAACFAVPAKSELKFQGKKLAGSAQRKLGNVILQHGSILCGSDHLNLVNFLKLQQADKIRLYEKMKRTTTDLGEIVSFNEEYNRLADCLANGFENYFGIKFKRFQLEENPASLFF